VKDCSKFKNREEDLMSLYNNFANDTNSINFESVILMSCLLCKNQNGDIARDFITLFVDLTNHNPFNHLYWFALARICQISHVYTKAEEAYNCATLYAPMNISYLEYFARYYICVKNIEKAIECFNRAIYAGSNDHEQYNYELGKAYFNSNEFEKAKRFFEQCKNITKEDYFLLRSKCYYILSEYKAAIECCIEGLTIYQSIEYKITMADALFHLRDYAGALDVYNILLIEDDRKKHICSIGACKSNLGDFEEAIKDFDEALKYDSHNTTLLINKAKTLTKLDKDKWTLAIDIYIKVVAITPNDLQALELLADTYFNHQLYDSALEYYLKIIEIDAKRFDILRMIGKSYVAINNYKSAISYFLLIAKYSESKASNYLMLGICYNALDEYGKAAQYYKKAIEIEPYNVQALASLADLFYKQKMFKKSAHYYDLALEIETDNCNLWDCYGIVLSEIGCIDKAIEAFSKVNEVIHNDISANRLGWAYYINQEYAIAKVWFTRAIEINSNEIIYKTNLFLAYSQLKQYNLLFDFMQKNREKFFKDIQSSMILSQLFRRFGDSEKAIEILDELLECEETSLTQDIIWNTKGFIYYLSDLPNRIDKAINSFLSINDDSLSAMFIKEESQRCLGLCYLEKGEYTEAIASFRLATEVGQNNAINWNNLGVAYLRNGNMTESINCFGHVMNCDNAQNCVLTYYVFTKTNELSKKERKIAIETFYNILNQVYGIKSTLKFNATQKSVFHYTTQSTLAELIKENSRLRMNNSVYMNDPQEGLAFSFAVGRNQKYLNINEPNLIENKSDNAITRHSNTFLASFSEDRDNLSMWVHYASNASGCSLALGDDFFDLIDNDVNFSFQKIIQAFEETTKKQDKKNQLFDANLWRAFDNANNLLEADIDLTSRLSGNDKDGKTFSDTISTALKQISSSDFRQDPYVNQYLGFISNVYNYGIIEPPTERYCLYKVCYIDLPSKRYKNMSKQAEKQIKTYIGLIKDQFDSLSNKKLTRKGTRIIESIANECIDQIRYLFKSSDYEHEKEVRLVIFEPIASQEVKTVNINQRLPKLYIEIGKPVNFKEVILGAKVEQPDELIPALIKSGKVKEDKITMSAIKYR